MSDRKLAKAVQSLFRQIWKLYRSMTKAMISWLLRSAFVLNRKSRRSPAAGFVLPTTVLLILIVALTAGALSYRAFSSSNRVITQTQNRVIYNAATPAIDRARAKLEFLFDPSKDSRLPSGVPAEELLTSMLLNDGSVVKNLTAPPKPLKLPGTDDPYQLPDEKRVDLNGDGKNDNAWTFRSDTDGDGQTDATVIYSITFSTPANQPDPTDPNNDRLGVNYLLTLTDQQKANGEGAGGRIASYVRGGPLVNSSGSGCVKPNSSGVRVDQGWYEDLVNSSILRKNFQVDAFVVPDRAAKETGFGNFATLEFQQDRQLNRGNKWGAWFRNDLEIFPGPQFNWNGAMHTEGSLMIGGDKVNAYLISSPNSCLYYPASSSEITVTERSPSANDPDADNFKGIILSGRLRDNDFSGRSTIYIHGPNPKGGAKELNPNTDWATGGSPSAIALDAAAIETRNGYKARGNPGTNANVDGKNDIFQGRFGRQPETAPYVDDTYRADNRYGPKQKYNEEISIPAGKKAGDPIVAGDLTPQGINIYNKLVPDPDAGAETSSVGLDGYWERRARLEGMRILVGERLELGNSNGWVAPQDRPNGTLQNLSTAPAAGDNDVSTLRDATYAAASSATADSDYSDNEGDPLYPPYTSTTHEQKQRRALRDNLAAVQAAAVYHSAVSKDYPIACLASTSHPGSPFSLRQSIDFRPTRFKNSAPAPLGGGTTSNQDTVLLSNFFLGQGTNGWEFEPPLGNQATFEAAMGTPGHPMRIALQNLAQFAGDHSATATGAYPPTQDNLIHPYPNLTMWGNFSNLRRTLSSLTTGGYANLSPADKTYLQTAACTLGMLAYNIDHVQRFNPSNPNNDFVGIETNGSRMLQRLGDELWKLMDGIADANNSEVLPKERLSTYKYDASGTNDLSLYNPRDYDRVPAEAFIGKLRERYLDGKLSLGFLRQAELILTHFQVRRDRTYGFRPSPAANTWNYNPFLYKTNASYGSKTTLWSSACDPNVFSFNGVSGIQAVDAQATQRRVGLSRLCGTVIPAGGVRQMPGDLNLPARKDTANASYLPTPLPNTNASATPINPLASVGASTAATNPAQRRFRELQEQFVTQTPPTTNVNTPTQPWNQGAVKELYLRATVAPKWPSLYYIFPETVHKHAGGITVAPALTTLPPTGGTPVAGLLTIDHQQPDKTTPPKLLNASGTALSGTALPAAFQPWAEPYVSDSYIANTLNAGLDYTPVNGTAALVNPGTRDYTATTTASGAPLKYQDWDSKDINFTYKAFGNPMPDVSVAGVALKPRSLPNSGGSSFQNPVVLATPAESAGPWQLPIKNLQAGSYLAQNTPPNRIVVPNNYSLGATPSVATIPFLDRVFFNGREWMPTRVMDIDVGMLRREKPANQGGGFASERRYANDTWLPQSGIVYAFREDSVREDAINRPAGGGACPTDAPVVNGANMGCTNATTIGSEADPRLAAQNISVKAIDFVPDPDRRAHGFRLRNATQLKRIGISDKDNIEGLSFFTDDPVYIMGSYNLHQSGGDDQGNPPNDNRLEEFLQQLPVNELYTESQFYDRKDLDDRFANPEQDRWRPSEILADSITILSDQFCDGSAIDTFMTAGSSSDISASTYGSPTAPANTKLLPYQPPAGSSVSGGTSIYGDERNGLFGPGCSQGRTSFLNQNRPKGSLSAKWDWIRENPADLTSPVKISRNGNGFVLPPTPSVPAAGTAPNPRFPVAGSTDYEGKQTGTNSKPMVAVNYAQPFVGSADYYNSNDRKGFADAFTVLPPAADTRVNSILISGLIPSRTNQAYGGMHNFPRLIESWQVGGKKKLWFSGSFLQLNFSNYATAPYDQDAWEPSQAPQAGGELIGYYNAPDRLWGYDVALQIAKAGPAASRFVTQTKERNEFYTEPAATDPYIRKLCQALQKSESALQNLNCPT